jgi:FkbM family methyltransferase
VAARFRQMIEINKVKNINLWPIGLGKEQGNLPFTLPPARNPAIGSLIKDWYKDGKNEQITVEIKRGDDLPSEVTSDVDLIKLDTEGYEKNIIIGLRETLRRNRPIIVMELNIGGDERWVSEEDIYKNCPPDYKLLVITPLYPLADGRYRLEEFSSIRRDSNTFSSQPNVLLFPSEKQDKIPLTNIGMTLAPK